MIGRCSKKGKGYIKGVASVAVLEEQEAAISTTLNFVAHESESSGNDQDLRICRRQKALVPISATCCEVGT
jgi:hypothetical protein